MAVLFVIHAETDSSSAEVTESGCCGDDAYYFIYSDGTLEIRGSGAIYDYGGFFARPPWYDHRDEITKIVISDDITYLGQWAFVKCKHVKELTMPITLNSVTSDTSCAFAGCYNIEKINFTLGKDGYGFNYSAYEGSNSWYQLTPWYQSRNSLKEIDFADGIIHIGNDAFRELNITKIVLPDSVTSLGWHTFFNCTKLTDLTIPISLNSYDSETYPAFEGCTAVENVTFTRGNGTPFDYSTFWGEKNSSLAPWNLNGSVAKTIVISDDIKKLGKYMFYPCHIRELTLPITFVQDYQYPSFSDSNDYLGKITLTKGTDGKGHEYVFEEARRYNPWNDAPNLKEIIVEDGVTYIGEQMFRSCRTETLVLPDSVTFGEFAFEYFSMKNLVVPISLNTASRDTYPVFKEVTGLEKVTFTPGSGYGVDYAAYEGSNCWYQNTPWYVCRGTLKEIVFEDGIKHIGSDAFRELNITSLVIPNSVESLNNHTFFHCDKLTSITIPMSLNSVASDKYPAFDRCNAIQYVHFTVGTDHVGFDYVAQTGNDCWFGSTPWYLCKDTVKEIVIDSGLLSIGTHTFENYLFYDGDSQLLPSEAEYLSGHTFTGENGVLYLDDSIFDASQDISLPDCIGLNSVVIPVPVGVSDPDVEPNLTAGPDSISVSGPAEGRY